MPPLEHHWCRRLSGAILCLLLALVLGSVTHAAMPALHVAGPVLEAISASEQMPMVGMGCLDCAACAIAPVPATHGLTCEGTADEDRSPAWPEQAEPLQTPTWFFDPGAARLRWPVRIAFCRWLD